MVSAFRVCGCNCREVMEMKAYIRHYGVVLAIVSIYLVILIGTIMGFDAAAFPRPTVLHVLNGVWAEEVESYFREHLGFHDTLFRIKSQTDLFIGENMVQGVYITDDMLLEKLYSEDIPSAEDMAVQPNTFYRETGVPTFLLLIPSASDVYEGRLPANAVNADERELIQATYAATDTGVRCMDAYNVLSSLKTEYIYYRTDRHWTSFGAYSVYQNAIQKMGFSAVPYQRFVISHLTTEFRGDLYQRTLYGGVKPDMLDVYTYERGSSATSVTAYYADGSVEDRGASLYKMAALQSEDMYRLYLGNPCVKLVIKTNVESGQKLLLYKDDFADCMVPFLLQHYSEICVVDLEQTGEYYRNAADPADYTQALFLCSMRNWEQIW